QDVTAEIAEHLKQRVLPWRWRLVGLQAIGNTREQYPALFGQRLMVSGELLNQLVAEQFGKQLAASGIQALDVLQVGTGKPAATAAQSFNLSAQLGVMLQDPIAANVQVRRVVRGSADETAVGGIRHGANRRVWGGRAQVRLTPNSSD